MAEFVQRSMASGLLRSMLSNFSLSCFSGFSVFSTKSTPSFGSSGVSPVATPSIGISTSSMPRAEKMSDVLYVPAALGWNVIFSLFVVLRRNIVVPRMNCPASFTFTYT